MTAPMTETLQPPVLDRATIPIYTAAELTAASAAALAEARRRIHDIAAIPLEDADAQAILDAWDRTNIAMEDAFGPVSLLNSVHPEKDVRDAADVALVQESIFMTEVFQNEALYERVRAVAPLSIAQKQLRKDLLEAFEDSGVSLPVEKRERFKEISERLAELGQEFARNIRE